MLRKTIFGILSLLVFSMFVLTHEIRPVRALISDTPSPPVMCELPRWLLAFLFILIVLAGGNLAIIVAFLLRKFKRKSETHDKTDVPSQ
jgi:hypothetical protein